MKQYSSFEKRGKDNATLAIRQAFNRFFSIFLPERPFSPLISASARNAGKTNIMIPQCGVSTKIPIKGTTFLRILHSYQFLCATFPIAYQFYNQQLMRIAVHVNYRMNAVSILNCLTGKNLT